VGDLLVDLRALSLERDGPQGPRRVVDGVDLRLEAGQRLAIVGGNGSGKSSLLRHLATPGVLPDVRAGLVFQDPDEQIVARTVAEELALGGVPVAATLARFGLAGREGDDPRLLSAGQKQRLQVATVLAGRPDLLLADEPTSLQDAAQAVWLREQLAGWDGALVWATQDPAEATLCDRVLVLDGGRPLAAGAGGEVLARPEVAALLTPRYGVPPRRDAARAGGPVARLRGVRCRFADGQQLAIDRWDLAPGDRLGVVGPNGCGKSTLLAILAGLRRPDAGTVELAGRPLYARGERDLDHGACALAPQLPEYLFTRADVAGEIALDPALAGADGAGVLATGGLGPELLPRHPHDLSGGQRRRLALALALASGRPLVLLDEPTAALDAAGRTLVARQVASAPAGAAIVVASHDRDFLAACGCRIIDLAAPPADLLHG
jgi:energy-coupling factor transport system ATP-binding protein